MKIFYLTMTLVMLFLVDNKFFFIVSKINITIVERIAVASPATVIRYEINRGRKENILFNNDPCYVVPRR